MAAYKHLNLIKSAIEWYHPKTLSERANALIYNTADVFNTLDNDSKCKLLQLIGGDIMKSIRMHIVSWGMRREIWLELYQYLQKEEFKLNSQ